MYKGLRKIALTTLIILAPLLFAANVWQSYRFSRVEGRLRAVQEEHLRILEENKRLIVGIAGLRSPSRIRELAEEDLGLEPAAAERIERILFRDRSVHGD